MCRKVLVTGSEGLIGTEIIKLLEACGTITARMDIRAEGQDWGDVRDPLAVARALAGCSGVIHLAAVSRVLWGERDPELCWETNVKGTENVLKAASRMARMPWVIFSSSREVYGQPDCLPVTEDAPLAPVNIYGRSKAAAETLIKQARSSGVETAITRFSNVYGRTTDYPDRVVPAFARAASRGETLRVDGSDHIFDFNHLDDTTSGLVALAKVLDQGGNSLPPIHFVSGVPTTLGELATMAIELGQGRSEVVQAPPRSYDVARFVGNPSRAKELLGWSPRIGVREGMERLIKDFRQLEEEIVQGSAA